MKIVQLQTENVKRLSAVEITPKGAVVEITGRNGQGKTSVLDSIFWALAGKDAIQKTPIRKGEDEARIRLDLGEIIVRRVFRAKDGGEFTTSLVVENAEGARFPSPQNMLDKLLGALSFDPLEFARMKPREQFDACKSFVPGVDFNAHEALRKRDFDRRTDANRRMKEATALAEGVVIPVDAPAEPVDEAALVAELEAAGEFNAEVATEVATRRRIEEAALRHEQSAERLRHNAAALRRQADAEEAEAVSHDKQASAQRHALEAEPPPSPKDTADVSRRIAEARAANARYRARKAAEEQQEAAALRAAEAKREADRLTAEIEARDAAKAAAIAKAEIPVPGLTFGDGEVLLEGVPFAQASDAQQLRAAIAIAGALNPTLRVIRVREGSRLDDDAMRELAWFAEAHDLQIWIETVSSGRPGAVVIEDGTTRGEPA